MCLHNSAEQPGRHVCPACRDVLPSCAQDASGTLKSQTWTEALHTIKERLQGVQGDQIRGIAGKLADAESMIAMKVRQEQLKFVQQCLDM